jgi:hypothetical protein
MDLLTKEQYNMLASRWIKHGTVYQKWDRHNVRFPILLKNINVFEGKNVLEVGSNAGLAGYYISQVAKSYIGVESEKGYYKQSLETQKVIESKNVEFKNMSIKSLVKRQDRGDFNVDVNAVFLSYVLYHFEDKEVAMFQKCILPKVDTVVVMGRFAKRNKKGRRKHNGYAFWYPDNVENFLNRNGFSTVKEWGPYKKFHFIIGRKSQSDDKTVKEHDKMIHEALMGEGKVEGGKIDADKRDSGVYRTEESETSRRRGARSGKGRVAQRKPRGATRRKVSTEGKSKTVLAKKFDGGSGGILQPVVEKSSKVPVRDKDVSEVGKVVSNRSIAETGEVGNG